MGVCVLVLVLLLVIGNGMGGDVLAVRWWCG